MWKPAVVSGSRLQDGFPSKATEQTEAGASVTSAHRTCRRDNQSPQTSTAWVRARGNDRASHAWVTNKTGTVAERGLPAADLGEGAWPP